MIKLKEITDKYPSLYQAGKSLNKHPEQLKRWVSNGALVDDRGGVYIKTKGYIDPDLFNKNN